MFVASECQRDDDHANSSRYPGDDQHVIPDDHRYVHANRSSHDKPRCRGRHSHSNPTTEQGGRGHTHRHRYSHSTTYPYPFGGRDAGANSYAHPYANTNSHRYLDTCQANRLLRLGR